MNSAFRWKEQDVVHHATILNRPIRELHLTKQIVSQLEYQGVHTVCQLTQLTAQQMLPGRDLAPSVFGS
jgi:hypothetical protein